MYIHVAFGAIAFSFGGTAAFPTIQCDMKHPSLFNSSIVMAYLGVLAMYLPVAILGFLAFGDDVQTNILLNLSSTSGITKCVAALIASHLLFSFIIVINPVSQLLEEWLNVPKGLLLISGIYPCLYKRYRKFCVHLRFIILPLYSCIHYCCYIEYNNFFTHHSNTKYN